MARQEPHYLKDFAVFALILCSGLLSTVDLHGEDYLGHMFREIGKNNVGSFSSNLCTFALA